MLPTVCPFWESVVYSGSAEALSTESAYAVAWGLLPSPSSKVTALVSYPLVAAFAPHSLHDIPGPQNGSVGAAFASYLRQWAHYPLPIVGWAPVAALWSSPLPVAPSWSCAQELSQPFNSNSGTPGTANQHLLPAPLCQAQCKDPSFSHPRTHTLTLPEELKIVMPHIYRRSRGFSGWEICPDVDVQ